MNVNDTLNCAMCGHEADMFSVDVMAMLCDGHHDDFNDWSDRNRGRLYSDYLRLAVSA